MQKHFGEAHGYRLFQLSRGIDERPVDGSGKPWPGGYFPDTRDRHYLESMLLGMADISSGSGSRPEGQNPLFNCALMISDSTRNYSLSEPSDLIWLFMRPPKECSIRHGMEGLQDCWVWDRPSPADTAVDYFDEGRSKGMARTLDAIRVNTVWCYWSGAIG